RARDDQAGLPRRGLRADLGDGGGAVLGHGGSSDERRRDQQRQRAGQLASPCLPSSDRYRGFLTSRALTLESGSVTSWRNVTVAASIVVICPSNSRWPTLQKYDLPSVPRSIATYPVLSLTIPLSATSWMRNPSMPGRRLPGPDSDT